MEWRISLTESVVAVLCTNADLLSSRWSCLPLLPVTTLPSIISPLQPFEPFPIHPSVCSTYTEALVVRGYRTSTSSSIPSCSRIILPASLRWKPWLR